LGVLGLSAKDYFIGSVHANSALTHNVHALATFDRNTGRERGHGGVGIDAHVTATSTARHHDASTDTRGCWSTNQLEVTTSIGAFASLQSHHSALAA
jgi:hypothetical protein